MNIYEELKHDVALLYGLAYVIQLITGEQEYSGKIELDFREGSIRGGRPSIPANTDAKIMAELLRPVLPKRFTGVLYLGSNLGVVNFVDFI
jgi:hypothetical protein